MFVPSCGMGRFYLFISVQRTVLGGQLFLGQSQHSCLELHSFGSALHVDGVYGKQVDIAWVEAAHCKPGYWWRKVGSQFLEQTNGSKALDLALPPNVDDNDDDEALVLQFILSLSPIHFTVSLDSPDWCIWGGNVQRSTLGKLLR